MDINELKNSPTIIAFNNYFKNLNRLPSSTSYFRPFNFRKKNFFNSNYSLTVQTKRFHVTKSDLRGYNKFYEQHRSKTYLFELSDHLSNTNQIQVTLHTNDKRMSLTPITYNTTGSLPKERFQISKMLTHFFMRQRVIPRRIQNKYFNLIRKKLLERIALIKSRGSSNNTSNRTTKTYFNFTYKKFRFHFGIYTPCSYKLQNNYNCDIPSPFVMSRDRTACSLHQKSFFHDLSSSATNSDSKNSIDSKQVSSHNNINNKIEHANHTFAKWTGSLNKKTFSKRLGISYDTSIKAVSHRKLFFSPDNIPSPMYGKAFDNYQENFSSHNSTKLRQISRLNRLKNRVFRINTTNPAVNSRKKKSLMEKCHTLLKANFEIIKPIFHLRYKCNVIPKRNQYRFNIPYFSFSKECKDDMISYYKDSTRRLFCPPSETARFEIQLNRNVHNSRSNPQFKLPKSIPRNTANLENWTAHPSDVKLRPEQIPFIPQNPLFSRSGELYYPPGSHEWRHHINRRLMKHLERTKEREYNAGLTVISEQIDIPKRFPKDISSEIFSDRQLRRINELTLLQDEFHHGASTILTPSTDPLNELDQNKTARWKDFYYTRILSFGQSMYFSNSKHNKTLPIDQSLKRSHSTEPLLIRKRARICDNRHKEIASTHLNLHHVTFNTTNIVSSSRTPLPDNTQISDTARNQISAWGTKVNSEILTQTITVRIEELTACQYNFHKSAKKIINTFWDPQIKTKTFNKHVKQWLQFTEHYNNDLKTFLKDNNDVYSRRPLDVQILKHSHTPDSLIPRKRSKFFSLQSTSVQKNVQNLTKSK